RYRGCSVTNDLDFYSRYPARFHDTVLIDLPQLDFRSIRSDARWKCIEFLAKLRRVAFFR
ncbi:hypothetical protein, partial [Rhodopseudomonas sp. BR0G17]|uniref:hypothetical protein n=1 Tax=Rhodopseudomonas sp. BR0G17 TaxID=2269368 RepID=UPI0019685F27